MALRLTIDASKPQVCPCEFIVDEDREQMQHQGESYHLYLCVDWRSL